MERIITDYEEIYNEETGDVTRRHFVISTNLNGSYTLHDAARDDNLVKYVDILLENGANVWVKDVDGCIPLHIAARNNATLCLKRLIKAGGVEYIDARDNNGMTPLMSASFDNCPEGVSLLIQAGADVDAVDNYGNTPLHHSTFLHSTSVSKFLIKAGANLYIKNKDDMSFLEMFRIKKIRDAMEEYVHSFTSLHIKEPDCS